MEAMTNQTGARARHKTTTRRAIQTAAIELYEERGYDETKVEDIVERAGVSQRSFSAISLTKNSHSSATITQSISLSLYLQRLHTSTRSRRLTGRLRNSS